MLQLRTFALLFALVLTLFACRCPIRPSNEAFCAADWVSHVKVLGKRSAPGDNLNDIVYALRHIRIFKNSQHYMSPAVFTSSESSACGLQLEVGKQYLLSGSFYDGRFHTSSCGQVVTDDPNDNFSGNLMEWKDVTPSFKSRLESFSC
ncbi:hypothetical protein Q1695_002904 [Nippostrongylus brasiliensis]|nr:hypothetical protein Q1695_002904 [Nippostrongylus brasiliensis]